MTALPDLGPHAGFIWTALGLAAAAMTAMALVSWRDMRQAEREADEMRARRASSSS